MDGVSWSASRSQESFSRSTSTDTLSRLASFIARTGTRQHAQSQLQQPSHLPLYVCQECGKGFPYAADLLQHQEVKHTLPKPHRCPSCRQEFSLRSSLQLHKCNQDSTPCERCQGPSRLSSPCTACTTRTPNPGRLQDKPLHRQPHLLDSSPYACAPCGRSFSQKQALLHHQQAGCCKLSSPSITADPSSLPDDSPLVSEGDSARSDLSVTPGPSSLAVSVCQVCLKTFRTVAALQQHKRNNHVEETLKPRGDGNDEGRKENTAKVTRGAHEGSKSNSFRCRSCDMVFKCTSKLQVHRKEKHSREKTTRREPRPAVRKRRKRGVYPCQVCCKVFFHHLSLRAHFRQHVDSQPIKGPAKDSGPTENGPNEVGKTREAGPEKPKTVPRVLTGLKDLIRVPAGGKLMKMPRVLTGFKDLVGVPAGAREEEKEFPCPSCAKVFCVQQQLKEHVELHQSSETRRQCSVCTNKMDSCKEPSSKKHRLYHCVPCQQGFSALDSFLEHCQEHLQVQVEQDRISESFTQKARKA
ncbi:zinc finger protein 234 [Nematolebias whitei]|uniref:zinc finger protein 234 n=1 Tax=Nematolebias whitei TaxID=451745 RepID=UPI001897002F|nr:zinc finger protein 234 [Nematolebias whitei]